VSTARCATVVTVLALAVGACLGLASRSNASTRGLPSQLSAALKGKWLAPGRTAAIAIDLETGRVVYAHNARRPFRPASNAKLPVGWAVLLRFGPDARIATDVVGIGHRQGRRWIGDLVLEGRGDPTLASGDVDALARTIAARVIVVLSVVLVLFV
jgi:D-alanyl-D-alanine carboxypeptidase/D-alanyl-D-alanine-endopeptidase (penicillin-binding protein 4)